MLAMRRGSIMLLACVMACGRVSFEPIALDADGNTVTVDGRSVDPALDAARLAGCAGLEMSGQFTNNFDSGRPTVFTIYENAPARVSFDSGRGKVIPGTSDMPAYAGVFSAPQNLTERRIFIEAVRVNNVNTIGESIFTINNPDLANTFINFAEVAGSLLVRSFDQGVRNDLRDVVYQPALHRWWQIKETSGTVFFQASANGITWTTIYSLPTPSWWVRAEILFSCGTTTAETQAMGEFHFDNMFDCKLPLQ
jgi:hypothetical protein